MDWKIHIKPELQSSWRSFWLCHSEMQAHLYLHPHQLGVYRNPPVWSMAEVIRGDWWIPLPLILDLPSYKCIVSMLRTILSFSKLNPRNYWTRGGRKWCFWQTTKTIFILTWPWSLTFWSQSRQFPALGTWITVCQLASNQFTRFHNIVLTRLVTDKRTDRRTNEWTTGEPNAIACQSGLVET